MPKPLISTNAQQLAVRFERRALLLKQKAEEAERENLQAALKLAEENSSGTAYNPRTNKTHPYARRAPHPPLPPQIANVQRGRLRAGWRTRLTRTGADVAGELFNVSPESRFFGGAPTRRMIARPLLQDVVKRLRQPRLVRITKAIQDALRTK